MGLAAALRELGDAACIIFISSNHEMALRGYEVSAARYLAKPLQAQQLREALMKWNLLTGERFPSANIVLLI